MAECFLTRIHSCRILENTACETEPWVAQYSTSVLFRQAATTILLFRFPYNLNCTVLSTLCDGIGA